MAVDHTNRFRHLLHIAGHLQLVAPAENLHLILAFDQLDILVKASKQSHRVFHAVDINTLFRHSIT